MASCMFSSSNLPSSASSFASSVADAFPVIPSPLHRCASTVPLHPPPLLLHVAAPAHEHSVPAATAFLHRLFTQRSNVAATSHRFSAQGTNAMRSLLAALSGSQANTSHLNRIHARHQQHPHRFATTQDEIKASPGDGGITGGGGRSGDGSFRGDGDEDDTSAGMNAAAGGLIGAFWHGWKERVRTDPQFPYKVLMEQVVGVGASMLGDMASRPNFGLTELDFVFSTLVVGSIVNFLLMYVLAPTGNASLLPGLFASCPPAHMFEPGSYHIVDRLGTLVYKAGVFAVVGFAAGLAGTAISTLLLQARKKMDADFVAQNKCPPPPPPPPTVANAVTWGLHMGLSSNPRYQALNGLEFWLANVLTSRPAALKACVSVARGLNNIIGGASFVLLARLTGSQKPEGAAAATTTVAADDDDDRQQRSDDPD